MAGPGICVLCFNCVFNPVAPYGYLLSDMYLFMADITNPDFLGLVSTSPAFVSSSASHPAGPHAKKTVNRGGSTQYAQQLEFAATALPLVGCVVWSTTFSSSLPYIQLHITLTHSLHLSCLCLLFHKTLRYLSFFFHLSHAKAPHLSRL